MSTTAGPSSEEPGATKSPAANHENGASNGNGGAPATKNPGRNRRSGGHRARPCSATGSSSCGESSSRTTPAFAGHLVDVAPEINGRLIDVAVHEGLFIRKGTVVFRLDPAIPQAVLDQAEARWFLPGPVWPRTRRCRKGGERQPARGDQGGRGDRQAPSE